MRIELGEETVDAKSTRISDRISSCSVPAPPLEIRDSSRGEALSYPSSPSSRLLARSPRYCYCIAAGAALISPPLNGLRAQFPSQSRPPFDPLPSPLYPNYSPPVFFTRYQIFHPHFAILQIRAVCFFNSFKVEFFFTRFPENLLEQIRQLISTIRGGDRKSIV